MEKQEILPDRVTALEVQISEFRAEVGAGFSATRAEMRALNQAALAKIDETGVQMRVLHEDVIARFNLLEEHSRWKRPTAPRRRKR